MGEIRVLTQNGDETLEWDPDDKASVEAAKKEHKRLKGEGYRFYEVVASAGKEVKRFDKKLGRLIAAPGGRTKADRSSGARQSAMAGGPVAASSAGRF